MYIKYYLEFEFCFNCFPFSLLADYFTLLHYTSALYQFNMHLSSPGLFLKEYKASVKKLPNFGAANGIPANVWWSEVVKNCFRGADPDISETTLNNIAAQLYVHYQTPDAWEFLPGAVDAISVIRILYLYLCTVEMPSIIFLSFSSLSRQKIR